MLQMKTLMSFIRELEAIHVSIYLFIDIIYK